MIRCPSVVDLGCLSRILDPESLFLPIADPGSKNSNKREGWKKICCHTLLYPQISQNLKLSYFWNAEEKNLGQFWKNYRIFLTKKLSLSSQKYGFGIRDPEKSYSGSWIPDPGVKKSPDPGSGSATLRCTLIQKSSSINPPIYFLFFPQHLLYYWVWVTHPLQLSSHTDLPPFKAKNKII